MDDIAHILFPSDRPKAPDPSLNAMAFAKDDAALRLMRRANPTPADQKAATMFPAEAKANADAKPVDAKPDDADVAAKLFGDTSKPNYDNIVSGELDQYALGAVQDGDEERADALRYATSALAADMRAASTDAEDLKSAFEIVRHSAGMVPPTVEQREASFDDGMEAVRAAGITDSQLNAARSMLRDMEVVSPGVFASLNAHMAGNDIRLIRAAVKEAARRGYR